MRKHFILIAVGVPLLFWACKSTTSNPVGSGSASGSYWPLAVGDVWVYHGYDLDSTGAKVAGSDRTEVDSISGTAVVGGVHAFVVHSTVNDTVRQPGYYATDTAGNPEAFIDTSAGAGRGFWKALADFGNSTVGGRDTSVTVFTSPYGFGPTRDTVFETYMGIVPVTTPAGTFSGKSFRDSAGTSTTFGPYTASSIALQTIYFVAGVGMVKSTAWSEESIPGLSNTSGSISELVSYRVQ